MKIPKFTFIGWMDACLVVETVGGRKQRSLLARLLIVYSGAIDASDNQTLSSRNVETPSDTLCISNGLPRKKIDHKAERIAELVKESVRTLSQAHVKSSWPSPDPDSNSFLQLLRKV